MQTEQTRHTASHVYVDGVKSGSKTDYHHRQRDDYKAVDAYGQAGFSFVCFPDLQTFVDILDYHNLRGSEAPPSEYDPENDPQHITAGEQGAFRHIWSNPSVMIVTECNPFNGTMIHPESTEILNYCPGSVGIEGDEHAVKRVYDDILTNFCPSKSSQSHTMGEREFI